MVVYLVDKLVEVVFVSGAKVDEGLDCLVGVGGNILSLACFDDTDHVVKECSEICDAIVDICRLVDSYKGLIEDGE